MKLRLHPRSAATLLRTLADRWLPRTCALCDCTLGTDEPGLCDPCANGLPGRLRPRCARCGMPADVQRAQADPARSPSAESAGASAGPAGPAACCLACRTTPPAFGRTLVLADYAPPLDRLIQALKFRGELALAGALGARMAPLAAAAADIDALVPVPLAPQRIAGRGFNQSAAICAAIARACRLPVAAGLLARRRETPAQSTLALAARQANLAGAFVGTPAAAGLRLAVVDDVMTTGATLQAAASALKAAGACSVVNLVAARTP